MIYTLGGEGIPSTITHKVINDLNGSEGALDYDIHFWFFDGTDLQLQVDQVQL